MAAKKKKKPASNPARGFTTVSLPSKAKVDDGASEAKIAPTDTGNAEPLGHARQGVVGVAQPPQETSSIPGMTPDQLEEHLEDAELQNIVEKFAERSKREASRQMARLETERRTLRAQAMPLETDDWLTEDLVEEVFKLHHSDELAGPFRMPQNDKELQKDDLLVRLWTLQQVLKLLHVPHAERVLKHVVSHRSDRTLSSKDYIWGLEESLDWLALYAKHEELPSYQPSMPSSRPFQNEYSAPTSSNEGSRATSPMRKINEGSRITFVESASTTMGVATKAKIADPSDMQPVSSSDSGDSTDDDNDPEGLVSSYIDTKLRLLKLEPEFQFDESSTMDSNGEKGLKPSQVSRLHRKVETIERDILFDHDKANAQLNDALNEMRADISRRRAERRVIKPFAENNPRAASPQETTEGSDAVLDALEAEEAVDGLFGEMFTPAETFTTSDDRKAQNDDDGSMLLLDFGKWTGVSPRRVLEDTCKTRDSGCKLSFRLLSSSMYSNRHSLQIKWHRRQPEEISSTALPSRLSYNIEASTLSIEMMSIATSTALQSEAYISTIALFALCAGEAKDEKVFLRLPAVWRKLWADLLEHRQAEIVSSDKSDLKNMRNLMSEGEQRSEGGGSLVRPTIEQKNHEVVEKVSANATLKAWQMTPENLRAEWLRKTSTPAFRAILPARQQLPISEHRERILQSLDTQQVTILCAETGAGKSTQVPAFILENQLRSGRDCRILVTQPRRISAMSLARRVSEELGEARNDIGTHRSLVGYAIRLESKTTPSTRITYATTGVLLRMLEDSQQLDEISHLVLDEVHERTLDLDLAFVAIRRLIQRRADLKIILMSATVDAAKFSTYFGDAPVLTVPGRTYPVEVRYLEDAIEETIEQYSLNGTQHLEAENQDLTDDYDDSQRVKSVATGLDHYNQQTRTVIANYDEYRIDYALITNLAAVIASHELYAKYSRAILIFVPGIAEIRRLHHSFLSHRSFNDGWSFNLLHSSFSSEDLEQAFMPPPVGKRKIVIATNIAETGITIPDITAVIDTCKEKTMRFDERRQMSKLTENFTSKSSCRQRRGRAARVQEGLCFHLVTKYRFENLLAEQHVPEMLRLSLQEPALRIKIWGFGGIEETLGQALDPPTDKNVRRAVDALKDVKALTTSEQLTPLGRQLARLPLDIWLGKLAILGIAFGCLDPAVTIASMMSSKSPFVVSNRGDSHAENAKLLFQRGDSDLLLNYNAYLAWRRACKSGNTGQFCRKNFLDQQALSQIEDQKVQLLVALGDARILDLDETERSLLRRARSSGRNREFFTVPERYSINDHHDNALTSLIAAAFYPKLLVQEGKGWRNISTNQQVSLTPMSANGRNGKLPRWLSFHETMQTKAKLPTVFDTSAVPESAIAILLGDAEFKMFAGVITIDGSKIRFRVRTWRTLIALKVLRARVNDVLTCKVQAPGKSLSSSLSGWANLWQRIIVPVEEDVKLRSVAVQRA